MVVILDRLAIHLQDHVVGLDTGDVTGSYNGYFVFLTKYGIYSAQKYDGVRYLMMVRYNGKLVVPGAVPQQ